MARSMLWLLASRSNLAAMQVEELGAVESVEASTLACHVSSCLTYPLHRSAFVPANLRPEPQRPGLRKATPGPRFATWNDVSIASIVSSYSIIVYVNMLLI